MTKCLLTKVIFIGISNLKKKISHIFVTYLVGLECTNIYFLLFIKIHLKKKNCLIQPANPKTVSLSLDFSIFLWPLTNIPSYFTKYKRTFLGDDAQKKLMMIIAWRVFNVANKTKPVGQKWINPHGVWGQSFRSDEVRILNLYCQFGATKLSLQRNVAMLDQ